MDLERLRALRPLYEARERRLRQLAGLEISLDPMAHLTAMEMLKANGINAELRP